MSTGRLRVLYVAAYEPSTLATRPRLLLGALAERHDLQLMTLRTARPGTEARIAAPARRFRSTLGDRLLAAPRALDRALPLQSIAVASRALRGAVARALRSGAFDLVHVEHIRSWQFVPPYPQVPVLFDAVDCVSQLFDQAAEHQPWPLRAVYREESRRVRACEARSGAAADVVVVASERDARALRSTVPHRVPVTVVTNPVDTARFHPGPEQRGKTVVLSGKMSYHANAVAARWFCERVWPRVRVRHPDATLVIAGARPPRDLQRRGHDGVRVAGYVDDLGAVIGRAAVAVAPLQYAVGVQNKLLEAMACETPVVATSCAAGDLSVRSGSECLIADGEAEFAARVDFLLSNPEYARRVGLAGRAYVERRHSTSVIADLLDAQYRRLAQQRHSERGVQGAVATHG